MKTNTDLLQTEQFKNLLWVTSRRPLSYREFETMPLPDGYDSSVVWDTLQTIRQSQAIIGPYIYWQEDGSFRRQWKTYPTSLSYNLKELETRARSGSKLDVAIKERRSPSQIIQTYMEDLMSILDHDRLSIGYESMRAVILGEKKPREPAETIARNAHELEFEIIAEGSRAITVEFVESVYDRLLEGVDLSAMPEPHTSQDLIPRMGANHTKEMLLEAACAGYNRWLSEPDESPFITAIIASGPFWYTTPFPWLNNLVGSIASKAFMINEGYPLYFYIPRNKLVDDWRRGFYRVPDVPCCFEECNPIFDNDYDWTLYFDGLTRLMLGKLDEVEKFIADISKDDERLLDIVYADKELNYRQKDVLKSALLVSQTTFTIVSHQKRFDTVYATARNDLNDLVSRGLLTKTQEDSLHVFKAPATLRAIIDE